ncbi:tyrosyl-DNA phosphodiesterase 1-like isoform X2 [Anneissia japonica]|uniref:tyrosyl-DNA phosphodiesterase 1-like isoform X2 n=1 Tax=Anneissia japonica TaxID=1529436 RepID=UPI0014259FCC|nr:tyrosyl-DNA phosphodiesterase 1-like isoform X2 [Anneissia japonica]
MKTSDEDYAAELQQKFDEEDRRQKKMEEQDKKLALALSLGHEISGSEDEDVSCQVKKKYNSPRTPKTRSTLEISDSDSDLEEASSSGVNVKNSPRTNDKNALNKRSSSSPNKSLLQGSYKIPKKNKSSDDSQRKRSDSKDSSDEETNHTRSKKRKKDDVEQGESSKKRKKEVNDKHSTVLDVIDAATPLSFFMTKVTGIASKYNNTAVHISELLSPAMGDLEASVQFNYMHDIPWLMQQYHPKFRSKPLLLVHGEQRDSKNALHEEASNYPNIRLCQARLEIMYGTHHSKMMILLYKDGLRVVIHTANLIHSDWHQKSQGVWISPLFPKLSHKSPTPQMGNSATNFKVDLLEYIAAYKTKGLSEWQGHLLQHDMTEARVHIIASVPGRHQGESKMKWGHMKMRKILKDHADGQAKNWSVIGQFSSVGSLGPDKNKWLCAEWLGSLSTTPSGRTSNPSLLKLIFPSVDNVRLSLEGYPAGASLPYSARTAVKQQYFNEFLHQWCATKRGRSRASPHIKTYARVSPDHTKISWFVVTSANLSKAAWGALEKKEAQLMIRSYEIGVLFLPKHYNPSGDGYFTVEDSESGAKRLSFPLPWDLPLMPYQAKDSPWVWDVPHTEKPDSNGNAWVPS